MATNFSRNPWAKKMADLTNRSKPHRRTILMGLDLCTHRALGDRTRVLDDHLLIRIPTNPHRVAMVARTKPMRLS